jgi:hypothetical protein
MTDATMSM